MGPLREFSPRSKSLRRVRPESDGMGPVNLFLFNPRYVSCTQLPREEGIGPAKELPPRFKYCRVEIESIEGRVPPNRFPFKLKLVSPESPDKSDGMVPVKLFESNEIAVIVPDEQLIPAKEEHFLLGTLAQVQEESITWRFVEVIKAHKVSSSVREVPGEGKRRQRIQHKNIFIWDFLVVEEKAIALLVDR
jgi:hypothetical protein